MDPTNPNKIEEVVNWHRQSNTTYLRYIVFLVLQDIIGESLRLSFLGIARYYRRVIEAFLQTLWTSHNTNKEDVTFVWDENCMSFKKLKRLTSTSVLALPKAHKVTYPMWCSVMHLRWVFDVY